MCLIIVILNTLYYLANKQTIFKCICVFIFTKKRCLYITKLLIYIYCDILIYLFII
jgi:hypothetical protein